MSITLGTGTQVAIASTYAAAATFSSISNAAEAVASFASDPGFAGGEYVEVTSGWGRLNNRVVRVKSQAGAGPYTVTFEDINTADTDYYPAGEGAGSVREITAWATMTQIKSLSPSGGEQQFVDSTSLDDDVMQEIPTKRAAMKLEIEVYDDTTLAWHDEVQTASDARTPYAMLMTFRSGAHICANAYWSISPIPQVANDQPITNRISLTYKGVPQRYAD